MSAELFQQLRRVEAQAEKGFEGKPAERAERRRRLRLELLRQHLTSNVDFLRAAHQGGASGQQSVQAYAAFMDTFLATLYRLAAEDARREGLTPAPMVLVALGGYGRGELHPLSDLDLMVIFDGEMGPYVQRATQGLLYTLWDLGLQVGHAVRSLPDCVAMARTDFASRTSMQQARYLIGDRRLFNRFRKVLAENVYRKDFAQFLETTLAERDQRYRKFGGSPYMGEPNVKESAGGLRDIHTAMWLASTKFGTRTLRELADKRLITDRERTSTDAALTFLWRVRNELHFLSGHKNDVLSRDIQPQIAKNFGYVADDVSLAVEKFMRDYYLHARVIHRMSRRLIARCRETLSRPTPVQRRLRQEALADGLFVLDGSLHLVHADGRAFREDPTRLMKVFWHSHQLGFDLGIDVERAIEESLDLVDETFQRSPEVRDLFLAICRNWGRTAQTLRELHELGVLGRYLPEWGALTCLVQYDVYHRFTADQHSLLAVENLEALAPGPSAEAEGHRGGAQRGGAPRPPDDGHAAARHRQGEGPWPRGQGHPPHRGADRAHRTAARGRGGGDPPRGASPHAVAHRPAARHPRSQDGGLARRGGGGSRAAAHALSPHLRRHARGGAGRDDGLDGAHPVGGVHAAR